MMYGPTESIYDTWHSGLNGKQIRDGVERWYHNGRPHRIDGPAFTYDTQLGWWWYGSRYSFTNWLEVNTELSDEDAVMLKLKYG